VAKPQNFSPLAGSKHRGTLQLVGTAAASNTAEVCKSWGGRGSNGVEAQRHAAVGRHCSRHKAEHDWWAEGKRQLVGAAAGRGLMAVAEPQSFWRVVGWKHSSTPQLVGTAAAGRVRVQG
jgi:hypothetical protein